MPALSGATLVSPPFSSPLLLSSTPSYFSFFSLTFSFSAPFFFLLFFFFSLFSFTRRIPLGDWVYSLFLFPFLIPFSLALWGTTCLFLFFFFTFPQSHLLPPLPPQLSLPYLFPLSLSHGSFLLSFSFTACLAKTTFFDASILFFLSSSSSVPPPANLGFQRQSSSLFLLFLLLVLVLFSFLIVLLLFSFWAQPSGFTPLCLLFTLTS